MDKVGKINNIDNSLRVSQVSSLNSAANVKYRSAKGKDSFAHSSNNRQANSCVCIPFSGLYFPQMLLKAYSNESYVNSLISKNLQLQSALQNIGLNNIYPKNITQISKTHLMTTTAYAMRIANEMGISPSDKKLLEQACVFHDFGKILVPEEIINKPEKLNNQEKEIMDMHAELGYQLLSQTNMNRRVLELIRNHHKPCAENADILGQILSVADIYSALKEQRSYKQSLTEKQAFQILDQKAKKGEVSTEVVEALKKSVISAKIA